MFRKACILLLTALFILALSSCKEQCGEDTYINSCKGAGSLDIAFVGFDSTQIDTVYLIRYVKSSGFSVAEDTVTYATYFVSNGTAYINEQYGPVRASSNCEIIIPGERSIRISDMQIDTTSSNLCGGCQTALGCGAPFQCPVISYTLDGTPGSVDPAVINK